LVISAQLAANCLKTPERKLWLESLPALVNKLLRQWCLQLDEPFDHEGTASWISPVLRPDGKQAVLKLAMPHMEGADEIKGLRYWRGTSMVELLEADDESGAMLLERCLPGTTLRSQPEWEQDKVVATVLKCLWELIDNEVDPLEFRPLSQVIDLWSREAAAQKQFWPDEGLVKIGLDVMRELAQPTPADVVLATDLHAGNILRSEREPWLAIDPKPFVGDRTYDLVQHLMNCETRLHGNPVAVIERLADLAEVDAERLKLWTFCRAAADPRDDWTDNRWIEIAKALSP
jgi:streptomycin 6-kinase